MFPPTHLYEQPQPEPNKEFQVVSVHPAGALTRRAGGIAELQRFQPALTEQRVTRLLKQPVQVIPALAKGARAAASQTVNRIDIVPTDLESAVHAGQVLDPLCQPLAV
jgi:hypothetical protein